MLMRIMNEFKVFHYNAQNEGTSKDEDTKVRMKLFEQSLGILLKCAFSAVEALQTLDITHLIEHIAMVMKHVVEATDFVLGETTVQENLVISYLELVFQKLEHLNEENIMKQLENNDIVPLVLKHYEKLGSRLDKDSAETYLFFLASLMDSETYQTFRNRYICDRDDKRRLALFEGRIKDAISSNSENRKTLRALSDNILRFK
jgi:predicted outer membrane lipoprotein